MIQVKEIIPILWNIEHNLFNKIHFSKLVDDVHDFIYFILEKEILIFKVNFYNLKQLINKLIYKNIMKIHK
jgi:hypothetical protein